MSLPGWKQNADGTWQAPSPYTHTTYWTNDGGFSYGMLKDFPANWKQARGGAAGAPTAQRSCLPGACLPPPPADAASSLTFLLACASARTGTPPPPGPPPPPPSARSSACVT